MDESIPIWVVHNVPCCGLIVTLENKELEDGITGVAWMCPLHGEVNVEECRVLSRDGTVAGDVS